MPAVSAPGGGLLNARRAFDVASKALLSAPEVQVNLGDTHEELVQIEKEIQAATATHNGFLEELGLPLLPTFRA